jgi:hypothetical protein
LVQSDSSQIAGTLKEINSAVRRRIRQKPGVRAGMINTGRANEELPWKDLMNTTISTTKLHPHIPTPAAMPETQFEPTSDPGEIPEFPYPLPPRWNRPHPEHRGEGDKITNKQRAEIESQDYYEEQFAKRVTQAERMILEMILSPETSCPSDEEHWPTIFDVAREVVDEARYELAYACMTEEEREAMSAKLLKLEKAGQPLPGRDTLEGYWLETWPY